MTERMQRLAQFCTDARFEDLPPALVEQAKRHILGLWAFIHDGSQSKKLHSGRAAEEDKFFSLAVRVMPREQAEQLLEQLWWLDELQSVGSLDRWLVCISR